MKLSVKKDSGVVSAGGYVPWERKLQAILDEHNRDALRARKVVSGETREDRAQIIFLAFRQLRDLGYKIEEPRRLRPKHVQALVSHWENQGLANGTLANRISVMRGFCEWIGKPGMVGPPESLLENPAAAKRTLIAREDKTWSAKGLDIEKLISEISLFDKYTGMQLKVIRAFGLRRKEGVMLRPRRADKGAYLSVSDGTKGGRDRVVPIDNEYKRAVLDEACEFVRTLDGHLGRPGNTLEQELERYNYVLKKFGVTKKELGVTGHGLRHEYLNARYEEIAGVPSPLRRQAMEPGSFPEVNPERDLLARMITTEEAGHARLNITGTYYGKAAGSGRN